MMKKSLMIAGSLALLVFAGCADKVECGVDKCGRKYVDKTYRSYEEKTPICSDAEELQLPSPVLQTLPKHTPVLKKCDKPLKISVIGQGVAPCNGTCSPAQSIAMAKRAAIADAYRLIAEKVKGVYVEGNDLIKNMMVKNSTVKTSVSACIRNANIVETKYKDGLCEVEMEVSLLHSQFVRYIQ